MPDARLVMRTARGALPDGDDVHLGARGRRAGTRTTLRNRGAPSFGFSRLLAPFMEAAMRRANRQDLVRLKAVLGGDAAGRLTLRS